MKALLGAFNQEKALVGAFSVIVQPVVEPMDRFTALISSVILRRAATNLLCSILMFSFPLLGLLRRDGWATFNFRPTEAGTFYEE